MHMQCLTCELQKKNGEKKLQADELTERVSASTQESFLAGL